MQDKTEPLHDPSNPFKTPYNPTKSPIRKGTNIVSMRLKSEINKISLQNLPKCLKTELFLFKYLHYFLLFTAIFLIIYRRVKELKDIEQIEQIDNDGLKRDFYRVTGMIYVKYNCEIINFMIFKLFIVNLHRKDYIFYVKLVCEFFIIILMITKIAIYIFELSNENRFTGDINELNILFEVFLLFVHFLILFLYVRILLAFKKSRLFRKIFVVHYLKERLKIE